MFNSQFTFFSWWNPLLQMVIEFHINPQSVSSSSLPMSALQRPRAAQHGRWGLPWCVATSWTVARRCMAPTSVARGASRATPSWPNPRSCLAPGEGEKTAEIWGDWTTKNGSFYYKNQLGLMITVVIMIILFDMCTKTIWGKDLRNNISRYQDE